MVDTVVGRVGKGPRHGRTVVTHRDEPDDVPEAVFDRIAAMPIARGEFVRRRMRGDGQTAGHGRTSLVRPVSSHGLLGFRRMGREGGGTRQKFGGMSAVNVGCS